MLRMRTAHYAWLALAGPCLSIVGCQPGRDAVGSKADVARRYEFTRVRQLLVRIDSQTGQVAFAHVSGDGGCALLGGHPQFGASAPRARALRCLQPPPGVWRITPKRQNLTHSENRPSYGLWVDRGGARRRRLDRDPGACGRTAEEVGCALQRDGGICAWRGPRCDTSGFSGT
jgi:hypothetical protein